MKKHYSHRITKRERAAVDVLYGPIPACTCGLARDLTRKPGEHRSYCLRAKLTRQTPLPGLATK